MLGGFQKITAGDPEAKNGVGSNLVVHRIAAPVDLGQQRFLLFADRPCRIRIASVFAAELTLRSGM